MPDLEFHGFDSPQVWGSVTTYRDSARDELTEEYVDPAVFAYHVSPRGQLLFITPPSVLADCSIARDVKASLRAHLRGGVVIPVADVCADRAVEVLGDLDLYVGAVATVTSKISGDRVVWLGESFQPLWAR